MAKGRQDAARAAFVAERSTMTADTNAPRVDFCPEQGTVTACTHAARVVGCKFWICAIQTQADTNSARAAICRKICCGYR
jgi:hypothetical protein